MAHDSYLTAIVEDAVRFILYFKTGLENYPLQVYSSALVFSPTSSITRNQFGIQKPLWLAQEPAVEKVWDACLHTLEPHGYVKSTAFSHDSDLIASTCDINNTVELWDARNGQRLHKIETHDKAVRFVFFPCDSPVLASVGYDRTVELWDPKTGDCVHTIPGNGGRSDPFTISPNLKLFACLSVSDTKAIEIREINGGQLLQTLEGHSNVSERISFSYDSKLLVTASGEDSSVRIWDSHSGQCLKTLESHESHSFAFSRNSKTLACISSSGDTLNLWDCSTWECMQTFEVHPKTHVPITFSHDSSLLACLSHYSIIKVWDIRSGKCLQTFQGHAYSVYSLAFSPDSRLLASGSADGTVKVWSMGSQPHAKVSQGHTSFVELVTFSVDSKLLVSCSDDSTIKVWNTGDWQCIQTLSGLDDSLELQSVAISHDSRLLAIGTRTFTDSSEIIASSSSFKIWDIGSGRYIQTIERDSIMSVNLVVLSIDSKFIASNSYLDLKVWNIIDGQCICDLSGHTEPVKSATFSDDSKLLASGSYDNTVKLWDLNAGECVRTLEVHLTATSVRFSPSSRLLASHSLDGIVKLWDTTEGCCLRTIDLSLSLPNMILSTSGSIISFDDSAGYLRHNFGVIKLDSNLHETSNNTDKGLTIQVFEGLSLSWDECWITWNSQNLLWLPADYRPRTIAVSLSKVVFAHSSGRMLFFDFDYHKLSELFPRR